MRLTNTLVLGVLSPALMVLAGARPVMAATVYQVNVAENGFQVSPCSSSTGLTSSTPISESLTCGQSGGTINASATSSQGHVGAFLDLSESAGGPTFANARFTTDVIFSSLDPNAPQDPISIALNLAIFGSITVAGSAGASWFASAEIEHTAFSLGNNIDTLGNVCFNNACLGTLFFSSGGEVIQGGTDTVSGVLTTPFVSGIPLNTPISIDFFLQLQGNGSSVTADFLNSLDFRSGGPVFTLPSGFTANATDAFLIDNRFGAPASVPEPGSLLLLAAGLAGVAGIRRLRFGK